MDKKILINRVRGIVEDSTKAQAEVFVNATLQALEEGLIEDGIVKLHDWGNFEVRTRSARTGRNPKTGEEIDIPESKTIGFKAGKRLKGALK